jgi:triphosphoribosyl-dephospho-CoA synthase
MWFAASVNDRDLKTALLQARDIRQLELQRALDRASAQGAAAVITISTNVPGQEKHQPGLTRLLHGAEQSLPEAIGLERLFTGRDLLGPWHVAASRASPLDAKRAAVAIETDFPAGRLLDLDVYRLDGAQIDRAALGLPPRVCLICLEPARECILLQRHAVAELRARVNALLQPFVPSPARCLPHLLATNLVRGAHLELDLTPKPGLVDRHDSGSHTDLTHEGMRASADLLPRYFDGILRCFREQSPLEDFVQAGIDAESRMIRTIHSNAHRGFIFLSGLVLMAACEVDGRIPLLRPAISDLATRFFARHAPSDSHGAGIRNRHALGGIRAEAQQGLPAVFEHGWPRYREALEAGWGTEHASFYLMAILMQRVEDTTAVRRCGLAGLAHLRTDGARLQRLLEQGQAPEPTLAALNAEYRQMGLTMGGVADCMALTFALQGAAS